MKGIKNLTIIASSFDGTIFEDWKQQDLKKLTKENLKLELINLLETHENFAESNSNEAWEFISHFSSIVLNDIDSLWNEVNKHKIKNIIFTFDETYYDKYTLISNSETILNNEFYTNNKLWFSKTLQNWSKRKIF